jgi:type IV pilus biogenesis protein CpaD/CtpE
MRTELANARALGTITAGTWTGTTIANAYVAAALSGKTYEGLTLAAQSTGFTIAGGTASRTLTVGANASVSGTNTGDQDLSGYVPTTRTVNGHALSANVTISKGDIGLGNAENTALSTWTGSTSITTLGTIATGTWNGTVIANGYLATALTGKTYEGLTLTAQSTGFTIAGGTASRTLTVGANASVSGTNTGDQDLSGYVPISRTVNGHALSGDVTVTKGDVGLGNAENTAISTWAGSTNLVTLGTITAGTWNGSTIANGYIAAALTGKTYEGLTLTAQSTGFTIAGGTASRTLTVGANASVSGTNTGDQDLSGYVPISRTVNGHALSGDVTVTKGDVGLGNAENTAISTWAGSTNLVTLGTITAGTWNGSTIANGYIAAALTGKTYEGLTLATPTAGFSIEGNGANLTVLANSSLNGTLSGGGVVATGGFTITVLANTTLNGTLDLSGDLSGYMLKSNNLSDVSNATTARSNLQLGNLSLQNGTFSGNGALNTSGYSLSLLSNLSIGFNAVTITGNTTLDGTSNLILANNTADIVLSFPSPGSVAGQVFDVVKTSNNTFNVTLNLTLGDAVSPKLNFCGSKAKVVSDGSNYYALSLLKRDELKFNTGNGNGTSAKIRRFGVVELNVGTALSYTDSSANGTSITINEAGTYSVTYTDGHTTIGVNFGISLNSSQLTSAIGVIQAADRIGITTSQGAAAYGCAVATRLLQKGDVVRPHLASTSANDTSNATSFHIVRLW